MRLENFDFRIWDNQNKCYLKEDKAESVAIGILKCKSINAYIYNAKDSNIDFEFGGNLEIELWTGLKDKNGEKIFDGDIIETIHNGQHGTFTIGIDGNLFYGFYAYNETNGGKFDVHELIMKMSKLDNYNKILLNGEVVGNIHTME